MMEPGLSNIEFYSTPDGEVMVKEHNQSVRKLEETDRKLVQELFIIIRDRYLEAFKALSELYSKSERNQVYFEYRISHRFIRCNFGEYDQQHYDIDHTGTFRFEEVRCPLRGECLFEGVICKPRLNTVLTGRELQILKAIANGLQASDIAEELSISIATVSRHRENIKVKISAKNINQMVSYYMTHFHE